MTGNDYWKLSLETVIMVLENYQELSTGARPEAPSGYNNPESRRTGIGKHGQFEESCMLAAEVARRVRRCGSDGLIVSLRYGLLSGRSPTDPEQIAQEWSIPLQDVYDITRRVADYVTGRVPRWETTARRKGVEYREWVSHRPPKTEKTPQIRNNKIRVFHTQPEAKART